MRHTLGMVHEATSHSKRRTLIARATRVAAAVLVLGGVGLQSGSAAEDPRYPGLPAFSGTGDWVGPRAMGNSYVGQAQQWVRLPPLVIGAFNRQTVKKQDTSCGIYFPYKNTTDFHATGFLRSSKGASEPWGIVGPFTTRTLAFGSIPVEASIELRQVRDGENLPVGLEIKQKIAEFCSGQGPFPPNPALGNYNDYWFPATVEGRMAVSVTSLKVDGVDLDLKAGCGTAGPGEVALKGREWYSRNPENLIPGVSPNSTVLGAEPHLTTPYFGLANGGLLEGTVNIPDFAGCVTAQGEDMSRLLTATVSGGENRLTMRSLGLQGNGCLAPEIPTAPGEDCESLGEIPFPERD